MKGDAAFSWGALLEMVRAKFPDLYRTWFEALPDGTLATGELDLIVEGFYGVS